MSKSSPVLQLHGCFSIEKHHIKCASNLSDAKQIHWHLSANLAFSQDWLCCLFFPPDFIDWGCVGELLGWRAESDLFSRKEKEKSNRNISHLLAKYSATCANKHLSQMNFDSTQRPQRIPAVPAAVLSFNAGPISGIVISNKTLKTWENGIQAEKYWLFFLQNLKMLS